MFFLIAFHDFPPQLSSLLKTIKNDKTPPLRNYVVLPLLLNPEKDDALFQMTEGRIPIFNHEIVPHALRTKPEPGVEQFQQQLEARMLQGNADAMQVRNLQDSPRGVFFH